MHEIRTFRARPPGGSGRGGSDWLGLLLPHVVAFAILIGLGVWQIERKAWKEGLIADLTAAPRRAAAGAAAAARLGRRSMQPSDEYRRVRFTAQFDNDNEALVFASASGFRPDVADAGPGYWVFTPARLADGGIVIVNRGFVPDARRNPANAARRARCPARSRWSA